jgi:hypothetical protein
VGPSPGATSPVAIRASSPRTSGITSEAKRSTASRPVRATIKTVNPASWQMRGLPGTPEQANYEDAIPTVGSFNDFPAIEP